jgi:hypothetical protein
MKRRGTPLAGIRDALRLPVKAAATPSPRTAQPVHVVSKRLWSRQGIQDRVLDVIHNCLHKFMVNDVAQHNTQDKCVVIFLAVLCFSELVSPVRAQQPQAPEDPEDEKQIGLWLDQGLSDGLAANKSLELEFHERFDDGASNLFENFIQAGVAFRLRPWLTVLPSYRYQRFPGNPTVADEHRLLLNVTLSTSQGNWRAILRTQVEERFPDDRPASARVRFRPGIEHPLWSWVNRRPVLVVNDEFFFVPGTNSFAAGGTFTQNRFQVGVRLPITDSFSVRPYYLLQSVNLPDGWETNEIIGISIGAKIAGRNK